MPVNILTCLYKISERSKTKKKSRVTEDYRRLTDKSKATIDKSQAITDEPEAITGNTDFIGVFSAVKYC